MATTTVNRMRVVVEMIGSDPFGLRQQAEDFCNAELSGESYIFSSDDRFERAQWLLDSFLATIDENTTGADRLAAAIVID